ncbi:aldose 1-epimerase [Paenibacillus sp. 1P07SE]|uniref:aldose 1-epimerase n=1 Tax=Paenibacillus sp. 1P07SE TaxID=3132209 RepID=UPI0039A4E135
MRYKTEQQVWDGCRIMTLEDTVTGSEAWIVPELGCNAVRLVLGGRTIVLPPPGLDELRRHASLYGIPVLSPPNRVRYGRFTFDQRTHQLPLIIPQHHIHGELKDLPWKVMRHEADEAGGASLSCELRIPEHPGVYDYYPHALVYRLTYTLLEGELRMHAEMVNEGALDAPFALGFHPYFHLTGREEEEAVLTLPAVSEWPIGEDRFVSGAPADGMRCASLREGMRLADLPATGYLLFSLPPRAVCELDYGPSDGHKLVYELSEGFPFLVLFRPQGGSEVSLEPYTCITDAFNYPEDESSYGRIRLRAGERSSFRWVMRLEAKQG